MDPMEKATASEKTEASDFPFLRVISEASFTTGLEDFLRRNPTVRGAMVCFDIQCFSSINTMFGMEQGDRLLRHIAEQTLAAAAPWSFVFRAGADLFCVFVPGEQAEVERRVTELFDRIAQFDLPFDIRCNAGIYLMQGGADVIQAMGGAILAHKKIKGSFTQRLCYYTDDIRATILEEQKIVGAMDTALLEEQFLVYYQPQYNHSTRRLIGAEALVRWRHPEQGLIPPDRFVPVFERTGFIAELDQYMFRHVCAFLRQQLDAGVLLVPVSVNLSRVDLFSPDFLERLEQTRMEYAIPQKYLRFEITESSAHGDSQFINQVLDQLHRYGYIVEMDDFGSGYSSLTILKDVDFDLIKLDTRFFQDEARKLGRGGTILNSVVRMIQWLGLPIIAEGVEKLEQADLLKSIGCDYIQGYLYAKPIHQEEFAALLRGSHLGQPIQVPRFSPSSSSWQLWTDSMETLMLSNYASGAAIVEYDRESGHSEAMRINRKFLRELGMNLTEKDIVGKHLIPQLEPEGQSACKKAIDSAIQTGEEQEFDAWSIVHSTCCGNERMCLGITVFAIARSREKYTLFVTIRNITHSRMRLEQVLDMEQRFKAASEQADIYYWEYTVATHQMLPCFRCIRDLGLSPVIENYPESAIEMGIFPPEVAEQYRQWHRLIDAGEAKNLEAVIPLTAQRVPYHVRYTTQFDEYGHPIKAYGSATRVVDK